MLKALYTNFHIFLLNKIVQISLFILQATINDEYLLWFEFNNVSPWLISTRLYVDSVTVTKSPQKICSKKHMKHASSSEYYGRPLLHHPYKWVINSIPLTVFNSEEILKMYLYILLLPK